MTLRQHLCADEDIDIAGVHAIADGCEGTRSPRRIAVDARDARRGERFGQHPLQPLRAEAQRQQIHVAAFRTRVRQALLMAAVMAAQRGRRAMHRQSRAAARAIRLPAAARAQQRRREAAAIDEHQRLLAPRKACRQGVE